MRDPKYKKGETAWDREKYKRLTFKVNRTEYDKLTPEQQKTLSEKVRQVISNFLKRPR